jgi:excisionase family DNA binding protein
MNLSFCIENELNGALEKLIPEIKQTVVEAVNACLNDQLLTVEEAAGIMRISAQALRKRIARGLMNVVRSGRTVRVRRSELFGLN